MHPTFAHQTSIPNIIIATFKITMKAIKQLLWTIALLFLHVIGAVETSIKAFFQRKEKNKDFPPIKR